jgi:hypothetical protein
MSIFGTIMDKIFHHGQAQAAEPKAAPAAPAPTSAAQAPASTPGAAPASAAPAKLSQIDVDATLIRLASQKGGGGNWRTSIVDLLKLLDLDSSLAARKQLAQELNVHAGADGTAEQNIALSKAVMQKLAENGGQVPASLRD